MIDFEKTKTKSWTTFGLIYGMGMVLFMEILYPIMFGNDIELWFPFLGKCVFWIVIGLAIGYFMKFVGVIK